VSRSRQFKAPLTVGLFRRRCQRGFENRPESQKFLQAGWFANVAAGTQPRGIGPVPFRVRGTEDHDWYVAALLTEAHMLQNLAARLFRKIQVDDREAGTCSRRVCVQGVDELYRLLAVGQYKKLARDAMFLERLADQPSIGRIVLHQQN
jgi:hypothetical protein